MRIDKTRFSTVTDTWSAMAAPSLEQVNEMEGSLSENFRARDQWPLDFAEHHAAAA
jgi:hypothetical protein